MKKNILGAKSTFLLTLIFVYVILFEFILPLNKVLPKPSILFESFIASWTDYDLLTAIGITTTIVYVSLIISFYLSVLFSSLLIKIHNEYPSIIDKLNVFRYFPAFFFAILFTYLFNNSVLAEFIFALTASILLIMISLIYEVKSVNENYILIAKNLGLSKNDINKKIIIKNLIPGLFKSLNRIHYYLWVLVMIYEFIANISGFGGIYKSALIYNDYAALFVFAIIVAFLIWFGNTTIKIICDKIFFWTNDKN